MARVPTKHARDQGLDFQGFLNNLQDWELSVKDKDNKRKSQAFDDDKLSGEKQRSTAESSNGGSSSSGSYLRNYDAINRIYSSLVTEDVLPDANSEKEQGNEYFKQKKFNEAIDCYSRSIAFSPTAVAFANRGMAYLKIKRFREAEDDCTEALNLDDRYTKAYSRRATARKELGKLKLSLEDAEFAMGLEPQNQEVKKQYADIKSLYNKDVLKRASGALKNTVQRPQRTEDLETKVLGNGNGNGVSLISKNTNKTGEAGVEATHPMKNNIKASRKASIEEIDKKNNAAGKSAEVRRSSEEADRSSSSRNRTSKKLELKVSVEERASRAASRAMAEAEKNIKPPNSAYEFENYWRCLPGDRTFQTQLLKVTSPIDLPKIFKNALTTPMLVDIIKCVAVLFIEDTDLATQYIENLINVPRFNMLIMCLSTTDKADLRKIWDEVFCNQAASINNAKILDNLRPKYGLNR